jgi:hypothetical protein
MRWRDYELDGEILKSNGDLTLCRSDKVLVEANKGSLVLTVKDEKRKVGTFSSDAAGCLWTQLSKLKEGPSGKP